MSIYTDHYDAIEKFVDTFKPLDICYKCQKPYTPRGLITHQKKCNKNYQIYNLSGNLKKKIDEAKFAREIYQNGVYVEINGDDISCFNDSVDM